MFKNTFQKARVQDLNRTLTDVNRLQQDREAHLKADSFGVPYIDLHSFPVDLQVLATFTEADARACEAIVFHRDGHEIKVGAVNPDSALLKERLQHLPPRTSAKIYLISGADFEQVMKYYSKVVKLKERGDEAVRVETERDYAAEFARLKDPAAQRQLSSTELAEVIFGGSMFYESSDIHLEPEEGFVKVRYRIDGVLQDFLHLASDLHKPLAARIKVLSHLKLNVANVPQDGRVTFFYLGKPIDVRVSSLPSAYGEEFVMRLLGTGAVSLKLEDLGLRPEARAVADRALQRPNGMVITTGPTGSGKTTTLYAFLNQLNEPGVKIITLEDPVEYKLAGIVQTPIDHSVDFNFAKGLRAILRQDPDVVMVGEIRDQETAEVAAQAALTGHLVLSTLHTNDSSGAIPRLTNMGVKPFVLAPALALIIAQRLVRKLCTDCRAPVEPEPQLKKLAEQALAAIADQHKALVPKNLTYYHSKGCPACHNLGYRGRVGIYEMLEVTEKIQELIFHESSMSDFKKVAISQGMITMAQDGVLKALEGLTDLEEVFRVAGQD